MMKFLKKQPPGRLIACGFLLIIFIGSLLLSLPISIKTADGIRYIDALYTSASAVCVTGLVTVDTGGTFSGFGQAVICVLMQIGGLGVASVGVGVMLLMGKKMNMKESNLFREGMNLSSRKGIREIIRNVFRITATFELSGAIASFFVFIKDFPLPKALWISIFHSVAAFNNAGFDILGNFENLISYADNVALNIITCLLITFGGIGFLVIRNLVDVRFNLKKLSMHSKVVLSVSASLVAFGTVMFKLTENMSWMTALFQSITARTAGFSTYPTGSFSNAGILIMMFLMLIGSSPGSTGGGVKTTTLFALLQGVKSAATNKSEKAFHYSMPSTAFRKACTITLMACGIVFTGSFIMSILEPELAFRDIMFEITSAFATVGLSTGITPCLCDLSKILSIVIMYIGRLGPLTIATLWYFGRSEKIRYPEGNLAIG